MALTDAQRSAVAELAKTAGKTTGKRSAYAELVVETVEPNHLTPALFSAFMNVQQMNPGDTFGRRVKKGRYPVRTMVPGAKHLTDVTWEAQTYTYMFDRLIAGTNHSVWEIENGEVGTVENMRNELRLALFDAVVTNVFNTLTTAWNGTSTPNNYLDSSGTGVTQVGLDTMIETVLDHSGQVRAIVGTRKALLPIYKFAQFREYVLGGSGNNPDRIALPVQALFDEFNRTGRVSTYFGIPLVELPQIFSNDLPTLRKNLLPTDRVLVVGDQAGTVGLMGGVEYQDYTDMTTQPPNYVLHAWQQYGMIIDDIEAIGVIKTNT